MRLFVAVNMGNEVSRQLWESTALLRDGSFPVRWVAREALHVTVKFLGETDEAVLPDIVNALKDVAAGFRGFELAYRGCGVFPHPGKPRVLWAGCEREPTLELLQHELERRFQVLGFPATGNPFRPHVTLGRVRRRARRHELRPLVRELERVEFEAADFIESVDLMVSTLGAGGARYDRLHGAFLGAA